MASAIRRKPRRSARRATSNKPPLDVDALWAIKRIGTPTLSPDGTQACSAVTSFDMETNESRTELWLFPTGHGSAGTATRARRLTAGDKDSDPKWSPDGRWIAFTAKILRRVGLELLEEHAVGGDLAQRLAVGRARHRERDRARRAVPRQADHAHVVTEVLAAELRADPERLRQREHFALRARRRESRGPSSLPVVGSESR